MFLDEATITVHGGNGGNGLVSWRKEKYVDKGGPWGGDGGNGGSVIIRANNDTDTLSIFAMKKDFYAEDGERGGKQNKHGKNGEDLILLVPTGTFILNSETQEPLADLTNSGDEVVIMRGGRGGYGNAHFATSIRQAPDFAELGEPGKSISITMELKLVAEVGIIGFPSVGKSTLISVISRAKPKIAAYPFTTLVPNLGVVNVHDRSFVVCDIPGLIEGASEGKGLGDQFLRHIERCGVLVHLLDVNRDDLVNDYNAIRKELVAYSPLLAKKREIIVLNKIDLIGNDDALFIDELKKNKIHVDASISSTTQHGIQKFLNQLLHIVIEEREKRITETPADDERTIIRPQETEERAENFSITEEPEGVFTVSGKRIEQIAIMTDFESEGGVRRLQDICERTGLVKALKKAGATKESEVKIGTVNVRGLIG